MASARAASVGAGDGRYDGKRGDFFSHGETDGAAGVAAAIDVAEGDEGVLGFAGHVAQAEEGHDGDGVQIDVELARGSAEQGRKGIAHGRVLGDRAIVHLGCNTAGIAYSGTL